MNHFCLLRLRDFVLATSVLLVVQCGLSNAANDRPNILMLYVDDMGWAQPGCYGGRLASTPHIDALAASGVQFTNGYSSGCICSPGRVGLMTGRYQARTGHDANATREGRELLLTESTIAQRLQPLGYSTGIVGKWHLGDTAPKYLPTGRGFDFAVGTIGNLGEGKGPAFYRGDQLLEELPGAPVTSPVYTQESLDFIERNNGKPWFLYLSFNAVHGPHVASTKWLDQFKHLPHRDQSYAAMIAEVDDAIGKVMAKLRELRQDENTLIFLISDNGGAAPQAEMGGLRGRKWFVWEGGIRVTWIAAWKGRIPAGRVMHDPVIQIDVLPTALAAAGGEAKADWKLDGVNLLPLLEGTVDQLAPRDLFFRFGVQHAVRSGDWKLVKASKDMEPMLINLAQDLGEQKDLSTDFPEKKRELQSRFDHWNAQMQSPRWEDARWNGDEDRKETKKEKRKNKTPK